MSRQAERTLARLMVTAHGPTVRRSDAYRELPIAKRIALLERWLESIAMELADLEDRYHAEG